MADPVVVITEDRRPEFDRYVAQFAEVLSGRAADTRGLTAAINARIAYTLYGFIMVSFEEKGRGGADEAGEEWEPLSEQYLAYVRPVIGRQPPRAGKLAPGGKDGYMSPAQLKQWQIIFARTRDKLLLHYSPAEASAIAAGHAWNVMKKRGVKTKLGTFGQRVAGSDYQTLVDTGQLRRSLQPGMYFEHGSEARYTPRTAEQVYESRAGSVTIGSRDRTAAFHHYGHGRASRRLWPTQFPASWWRVVLGQVMSGLQHFADGFGRVT